MSNAVRALRRREVLDRSGDSKSKLYDLISKGLWTKPIKLGKHASGWPDYECDILNAARIAGTSEEETRTLVRKLEAARATALQDVLNQVQQSPPCAPEDGNAANAPAQQKKHAAGTHPTTIARRDSTRRKATIREDVQ